MNEAGAAVRVGIVGLGAAGRAFVPPFLTHAGFRLTAIAEPAESARVEFASEHAVEPYASLEAMIDRAGVDAVCIATPTELHPAQAALASAAGKHVLVEKPMATGLDEAHAMIAAAERAGKALVVGHSHSYDLPIQRMRAIIASGELGAVRMVNTWYCTDWIYRPRRAEELDVGKGGGVTFRQGSHQFDILRLLCGGRARTVKARTFDWDPQRRSIGAHVVYLDFEDGAAATAVYNGYGHFSTAEWCFDIGEWGFPRSPQSPARPARALSPQEELDAKRARARNAIPASAPHQPFFGLTFVSCERGDIRQSPQGLYVHTREGRTEIVLPGDRSPRDLVVAEFHDAITGRARALHDGRWGLANLEVCVAAIESSRGGREMVLCHQVGVDR